MLVAFGLSPSPMEIAVIAMIALIVLGPSRLPEAARSLGKGLREMRDSFQGNDEDDDDDDGDDPQLDADLDYDDDEDLDADLDGLNERDEDEEPQREEGSPIADRASTGPDDARASTERGSQREPAASRS